MDVLEEYMSCHCGQALETYKHFMQCDQYKEIDGRLVWDQDIPLLKKGEKRRREMERELGGKGITGDCGTW